MPINVMPRIEDTGGGNGYRSIMGWLLSPRALGSYYVLDPLALPNHAEPLDRSGRPLPWRWHRSIALDLLGHYGLTAGCAALLVGTLVYGYGIFVVPETAATFVTPSGTTDLNVAVGQYLGRAFRAVLGYIVPAVSFKLIVFVAFMVAVWLLYRLWKRRQLRVPPGVKIVVPPP
jgi:hypothetical protein